LKNTGVGDDDFVSLTDIAKIKNPEFPADVIKNWMRLRSTIGFLGIWEQIDNLNFNIVEFDQFKNETGHNYSVMTPTKWFNVNLKKCRSRPNVCPNCPSFY